jgi:hypothetical protein
MPDPLPSDVVFRLKSDPMAALAAALIVVPRPRFVGDEGVWRQGWRLERRSEGERRPEH